MGIHNVQQFLLFYSIVLVYTRALFIECHCGILCYIGSAVLSKKSVSAKVNIKVDTFIERQISDQSTTVIKGCMYIRYI